MMGGKKRESLKDTHILVTREKKQCQEFVDILEDQGAITFCVPTIKIQEPPSWELFDKTVSNLSEVHWIIFSSTNAVVSFLQRLSVLQVDNDKLKPIKIAAIGSQTKIKIESSGLKVDLVPKLFQSEGLIEALKKTNLNEKTVWLPRAMVAGNILTSVLVKSGAKVLITPVYQNCLPRENIPTLINLFKTISLDWVTFTSSSTVKNFFIMIESILKEIQIPRIASIGELTTRTILSYGYAPEFTASPQNTQGMIQGLCS